MQYGKWSNVIELFDDGEYTAIWGIFGNAKIRWLGIHWTGEPNTAGYPHNGADIRYFVEPYHLTKMILLELCNDVNKNKENGNLENILTALKEWEENNQKQPEAV